MSQLTYPSTLDTPALPSGSKADIGEDYVRSYKNTTGAVCPFGVMVAIGAADDRLKRLTGPSDKLIGVVLFEHANNSAVLGASLATPAPAYGAADTTVHGVPDKYMASVMRWGPVQVAVEGVVAAESPCFVRHTANGANTTIGAFRADSDGGTAMRVPNARFMTSTTAAGSAQVMLDGPLTVVSDVAGAEGSQGSIIATAGVEGAASANAIDVVCSIVDEAGLAITAARNVMITTVAATADQGDIAAATAAVGTFGPAQNPVTGDNTAGMVTTAAGLFSFKVTDTAAEAVQVLIQAEGCLPRVLRLTFA